MVMVGIQDMKGPMVIYHEEVAVVCSVPGEYNWLIGDWINSLPAFGLFFPFDVLFDGFDEELNAEFDLTPAA